MFALAAAATLTVYFVVGERQVGATSPLAVGFWSMGFAAVFWGVFSGWWEVDPGPAALHRLARRQPLGCLSVPLALPAALERRRSARSRRSCSRSSRSKHLTATAAGITASSEVLFAFGVAWLWLGETLTSCSCSGSRS